MAKMKLCAFADEASKDLAGQIEALKRNNISLLEIRGVDGKNISEISLEKAKEVKELLDKNGISVWSIGSPVGKAKINENVQIQEETFLRLCEIARLFGCQRIRMFSFFDGEENEVIARLNHLCEIAGEDIILCHENEKGIYGDKAEKCLTICKEVKGIKAVFDPANFVQCGVYTKSAWEMLNPYVDYLHIKDALDDGQVVPAGQGIGNLEYIVSEYAKMGGEVLTLEPHLMEFYGLSKLENGESIKGMGKFDDENEAFDTGVSALKKLLDKLGLEY
ncbi:MAG: sugar phosphate isomerase/epimerase [Clostridia bacterium]|nr:sugar phosphate isomerase/epimerase [Clostridia bacterium]